MQAPLRAAARAALRTARAVSTKGEAATPVSAVAPSSAVKLPLPVVSAAATPPVVRFNVEDSGAVDVAEARRARVLSEVSEEYEGRVAVIYKVSQSSMTSGTAAAKGWNIRLNHTDRWSNQLMGWQSSSDTQSQSTINVNFDTPEQAVLFCERNGWAYRVDTVPEARTRIAVDDKTPGNQYSYNILTLEVQAKMKRAGNARRARHQFANPDSPSATGVSTWSNLRHTPYGPDPWRPRKDIAQTDAAWTGPEWPAPKEIAPPLAAGEAAHHESH